MQYDLSLNQQEIQILFMALGELPIKVGVNLLSKLQQSVAEQDSQGAVSLEDMGFSEIQPSI